MLGKKAYIVTVHDFCEVVFSSSKKAVAINYPSGIDCIEVERVENFDKYYPDVPKILLMADPFCWSFECDECKDMIGNGWEIEAEDAFYSKDGYKVFCSKLCRYEYFERSYEIFMNDIRDL